MSIKVGSYLMGIADAARELGDEAALFSSQMPDEAPRVDEDGGELDTQEYERGRIDEILSYLSRVRTPQTSRARPR